MEQEYKITYNDTFGVFTFVTLLLLVVGTTQVVFLNTFVNRTLNNGYLMRELLTLEMRIFVTGAGLLALTLIIHQRLLINELLENQNQE